MVSFLEKIPKLKITIAKKLFILDVCWLRLDFEQHTIQGPTLTTEANGGACLDSFTVTVSKI